MTKNQAKHVWIARVLPFFIFGISITISIALFILLFYVFVWGAVIGLVLWAAAALKEQFFPKTATTHTYSVNRKGRIIEIDEHETK